MKSPIIRHFEVSTLDVESTVQRLKEDVESEMRERIKATGARDIRVTFRALNEVPSGLVMNVMWEARADFLDVV